MTIGTDHPDVLEYLARLDAAAADSGVPPGRRAELGAEIRAPLAAAVGPAPDDAAVRTAIDRLGAPEEIVARSTHGPAAPVALLSYPPSPWGAGEVLAVLGLTVGQFLLPVVAPLVGLVLALSSRRWTGLEKTFATLWTLLPVLVLVVGGAAYYMTGAAVLPVPDALVGAPILPHVAEAVVLVLLTGFVGPLVAGVYLAVKLNRREPRR